MLETIIAIYLFNANVDFEEFFRQCEKNGINTVITNPFVYEHEGWIEAASKSDLQVIYNFPIFCETAYLLEHPGQFSITNKGNPAIGDDWLQFACPSNKEFVESQKARLQKTLETFDPKVFSLDFIRYYVFWEMVHPGQSSVDIEHGCWCEDCLQSFADACELKIVKDQKWILTHAFEQWTKWKCDTIERIVIEFTNIIRTHNPEIRIGIKTVPWRKTDFEGSIYNIAGQDLEALSNHIDFFVPMTYSHMVMQDPKWIHDVVNEVSEMTSKPVYPCLQLEKCYPEEEVLSLSEFEETLHYSLLSPSQGICIFHYDELFTSPEKIQLINKHSE